MVELMWENNCNSKNWIQKWPRDVWPLNTFVLFSILTKKLYVLKFTRKNLKTQISFETYRTIWLTDTFWKRLTLKQNLTFWSPGEPGKELSWKSKRHNLKALTIMYLTLCKKIRNSWQFNLEIFWKQLIFAKIWPFDSLVGLGKSFPEHYIYVFCSLLLLSNFMQKIKKFWCLVLKIFWKRLIFGKNLTFWRPGGLGKSFPKHYIYVFWSLLLLSNFMQKIKKFWRLVLEIFWKQSIFGQNLTFWPPGGPGQEFFLTLNICLLKPFIIV
jgi:hypothetical protein